MGGGGGDPPLSQWISTRFAAVVTRSTVPFESSARLQAVPSSAASDATRRPGRTLRTRWTRRTCWSLRSCRTAPVPERPALPSRREAPALREHPPVLSRRPAGGPAAPAAPCGPGGPSAFHVSTFSVFLHCDASRTTRTKPPLFFWQATIVPCSCAVGDDAPANALAATATTPASPIPIMRAYTHPPSVAVAGGSSRGPRPRTDVRKRQESCNPHGCAVVWTRSARTRDACAAVSPSASAPDHQPECVAMAPRRSAPSSRSSIPSSAPEPAPRFRTRPQPRRPLGPPRPVRRTGRASGARLPPLPALGAGSPRRSGSSSSGS